MLNRRVRRPRDLEAPPPQLIEEAVSVRFRQMAGKLRQDIEDTHIRTLETFVRNIQVKLAQRVCALETEMSKQAETVEQLREYSQRPEDNLGRLIRDVDRLAQDLPKRLAAPGAEADRSAMRRRGRRTAAWPGIVWASAGVLALATGAIIIAIGAIRYGR